MINKAASLCLLAGLVLLPGCAFMEAQDSNLEQKIDGWIAQQEYARALAVLDYVKPSHRNYKVLQQKQQQIIAAAAQFEQTSIQQASAQMSQQQWHEAEQTYLHALDKLPQSEPLKIAYQKFLGQRDQYLNTMNNKLTLNNAEHLLRDKPLRVELLRTLPEDRDQQRHYAQYQQTSIEVRNALLDCGLKSMHENELAQAERCFVLANELSPDPELQLTIMEIQKQLEQPADKHIAVLSDKGHAELALARAALKNGNLQQARQHYLNIPEKDKRHTLVTTFARELNSRIDSNVKQGIEVGRKLYSQGEIERALAVWNKLREIDPNNDYLISHIERAERVMKKLGELRQQDPPVSNINNRPAP